MTGTTTPPSGNIFDLLCRLGMTSAETREVYSHRTRDVDPLTVYRDKVSGVIYIDGFYVGDDQYQEGQYRKAQQSVIGAGAADFEDLRDTERRLAACKRYIAGKSVLDFGCGRGSFLLAARHLATSVAGIELQQDYRDLLAADGVSAHAGFEQLGSSVFDVITLFHVLEHLPDPEAILKQTADRLSGGGLLVVEVPHARDFLLSGVDCEAFRNFTLWSQHLVLHTRESLRRLLQLAGYRDIVIEGVQRYPLSNHLKWLAEGKPGGHRSQLSALESDDLFEAYSASLARMDATDTLIAYARK